jgi:hypothetical protein
MLSLQELKARVDAAEDRYEKTIMASKYVQKFMISQKEKDKKRLEEMSPRMRKEWLEWETTSEKKGVSFEDYYARKREDAKRLVS